jgi:hypothetical protein
MKIKVTFNLKNPLFRWSGLNENGRDIYLIKEEIKSIVQIDKDSYLIKIPIDFKTDGESIPRFFWRIYFPTEQDCFVSATLHDFLYQSKYFDRKICDKIFFEGLKYQGAGIIERNVKYAALRLFGWGAWSNKSFQSVMNLRKKLELTSTQIPLIKI